MIESVFFYYFIFLYKEFFLDLQYKIILFVFCVS